MNNAATSTMFSGLSWIEVMPFLFLIFIRVDMGP